MFSKFVASFAPTGPTGAAHPLSIAARLTLWQAVCGFLLLLAATSLLYWTLARSLDRDDDQFLAERMQVLVPMLAGSADSPSQVAAEIARETGSRTPVRLYIRLLAGSSTVVGETLGMAEILPVRLFPRPAARGSAGIESFDVKSASGHPFRAATTAVPATDVSGLRTIQIAIDRSSEEVLLTTYRNRMGVILLIGLFLFALTTWLIARRGMRPIAALTRIVQQVQANRMQPRTGQAHWPGELTELARSFDAMLERLEQGFQALEGFSADIAHELRTPLNILRGEAEVALSQTRSLAEYREVLASSLEEYHGLTRLVDSLLFLARAEHGSDRIERRRLSARAEALAVCDFYEALAAERQIATEVSGEAELFADPALFRRALSNLLSNALRHTPAGGTVRISLSRGDGLTTHINMSDTGCGIAAEHLPRIFERFYRVDPARVREGEGAGLGLAIVKSIVTLHGGEATIASTPGQGTNVTLSFPSGDLQGRRMPLG